MEINENKRSIEQRIIDVIEEIRPFLNMDGGDISFVRYENGLVYIKLLGACAHCIAQDETINNGVLLMLQEHIPEVKDVINVLL